MCCTHRDPLPTIILLYYYDTVQEQNQKWIKALRDEQRDEKWGPPRITNMHFKNVHRGHGWRKFLECMNLSLTILPYMQVANFWPLEVRPTIPYGT